jgi:hypothetical protein
MAYARRVWRLWGTLGEAGDCPCNEAQRGGQQVGNMHSAVCAEIVDHDYDKPEQISRHEEQSGQARLGND